MLLTIPTSSCLQHSRNHVQVSFSGPVQCISDSLERTQTSVLLPWKNGREWRHKRGRRQTCLLARPLSALPRAARGHSRPRRFYPSRWRHGGPWIDPYFSGSVVCISIGMISICSCRSDRYPRPAPAFTKVLRRQPPRKKPDPKGG